MGFCERGWSSSDQVVENEVEEKVNLLTTLIPNLDSRLQSADSKGTQRNLGREATRDGSKKKKKNAENR